MKKLAAFFAAIGIITQVPAVSHASWGDRNWDRMAHLAGQIEEGYDMLEDQADALGGNIEELAERGENLSDMLDDYLNPSSFERHYQYKSKYHLEQLWGAVSRNFLAIRAEMARLGIVRSEFAQFQGFFAEFDVYFRRIGGASAFGCTDTMASDQADANQGEVILEEEVIDEKKGEQGQVEVEEADGHGGGQIFAELCR